MLNLTIFGSTRFEAASVNCIGQNKATQIVAHDQNPEHFMDVSITGFRLGSSGEDRHPGYCHAGDGIPYMSTFGFPEVRARAAYPSPIRRDIADTIRALLLSEETRFQIDVDHDKPSSHLKGRGRESMFRGFPPRNGM
jgi:hypothetical protein